MRRLQAVAGVLALALTAITLASCKGNGYGTQPMPTGGELNSPSIGATGGVYNHTFNTAGVFRYKCTIHPNCTSLQGTVTVVSAATPIVDPTHQVLGISFSGGSPPPYSACSTLSNFADSVHVGQTVTWTNSSPNPHTVTSY